MKKEALKKFLSLISAVVIIISLMCGSAAEKPETVWGTSAQSDNEETDENISPWSKPAEKSTSETVKTEAADKTEKTEKSEAAESNNTSFAKNGWYKNTENGKMLYYVNDKTEKGLVKIDGCKYFFDNDGYMISGKWLKIDGNYYYFGKNGQAVTGHNVIDGTEYIFDESCRYVSVRTATDYVDSSDGLYTYDEMTKDIIALKKAYPEMMTYSVIGITADGRNIYDIVLGNPAADKQIVYQASCHAREYMTSLLVMEQLEYCLNGYYTKNYSGISFEDLFGEYAIHIIPMLNPDGVTISQYGKSGIRNEALRKNVESCYKNAVKWGYTNYTESYYYKRWKANAKGIDINRNFNGRWSTIETLNGPVGWNYKGEKPESEVESICITKLIRSLSNPVTVISYHATGSVLWWDYGQTGAFRSRCIKQKNVVSKLTGYKLQPYTPSSAGGLCDWLVEETGESIVPQLIEIGVGDAPLKGSEYSAIWSKNYRIFPAIAYLYYYE